MVSKTPKRRMTRAERRAQLIEISRGVFATKGWEAASMEEIAAAAGVSKPVVYEHFGTKENIYETVVKEDLAKLETAISQAITLGRARYRIEQAVLALLTYVEQNPEAFTIISRDPAVAGGYETLLNNATQSVTAIVSDAFVRADFDPSMAVLYANSFVGMVSQTARWWLDHRSPDKETVAAHIVNLCWNGLAGMEANPTLHGAAQGPASEEGAHFGAGAMADPAAPGVSEPATQQTTEG